MSHELVTNQRKSSKPFSKRTSKSLRRAALVPVPEHLALLMHLANLLPKFFRSSPTSPTDQPDVNQGRHHFDYVIHWWNTKTVRDTLSSIYHLRRLVDSWPLGLQAFVWYDDQGRYVGTPPEDAPLFDSYHLQPLSNITLLGQPEKKLKAIVMGANERINIETKMFENKNSSRAPESSFVGWNDDYQIGHSRFKEAGLNYLADRARQRFFFILAAEEILDALVGPDTQKKLNNASYIGVSGTTRSYLYVEDDEVKQYPSVLFSFVVGVQPSRIRRCEICETYFWAGRKDKKVCSARCSATNRKRQERQRYLEKKIGVRRLKGKMRKVK